MTTSKTTGAERQLWAASSLDEVDGDHETGDREQPNRQQSWNFVHMDMLTRLLDCGADARRTADECRSADLDGAYGNSVAAPKLWF